MTCIVALEHKGLSYIGSDSFMGNANTRDVTVRPKLFAKGERFVIGFAGSFRGAQLVEYGISFRKIKAKEDEESYLVTEVAKKIQQGFALARVNFTNEDGNDSSDACFLMCIRGKVFLMQKDYSVVRSRNGFATLGAGQDCASGALSAMARTKLEPKEKLFRALSIAAELSPLVCDPFHIIEV
jgi:ATP-dependent protease HslVU (ClpYQ) peptidase subunit